MHVDILELGLDRLEVVLCISTTHWHIWEQHYGNGGMEFCKVEEDFDKPAMDFGNLERGQLERWM